MEKLVNRQIIASLNDRTATREKESPFKMRGKSLKTVLHLTLQMLLYLSKLIKK